MVIEDPSPVLLKECRSCAGPCLETRNRIEIEFLERNRKELIMMNPIAMVALGATASIPIAGDSAILRSHEMRGALLLVHGLSDQESEASTELREHDLRQPHDPTAGVDVSPVPSSLCPASRGLSRTLPVKIVHFHFSC